MEHKEHWAKPISISMKAALARRIMAVAKERGYPSRSAFVRDLVAKELDGNDDRQRKGQKQ